MAYRTGHAKCTTSGTLPTNGTRSFHVTTQASPVAGDQGANGGHSDIGTFDADAGALQLVRFYSYENGGTTTTPEADTVTIAVYDSAGVLIKTLYTGAQPNNASFYEYYHTASGNSGGGDRCGQVEIRVTAVRTSGVGGVDNYNVNSSSQGTQGMSRGNMKVTDFTTASSQDGSGPHYYGTAVDNVITTTVTHTEPYVGNAIHTYQNDILNSGTTVFEGKGTSQVTGTTTQWTDVADSAYANGSNNHGSRFTVIGQGPLMNTQGWSLPVASGNASQNGSDSVQRTNYYTVDPRVNFANLVSAKSIHNLGDASGLDFNIQNGGGINLTRTVDLQLKDSNAVVKKSVTDSGPNYDIDYVIGSADDAAFDFTGKQWTYNTNQAGIHAISANAFKVSSKLMIGSAVGSNDLAVNTDEEVYNRGETVSYDFYVSDAEGNAFTRTVDAEVRSTAGELENQRSESNADGHFIDSYVVDATDIAAADTTGILKHVEVDASGTGGNSTDNSNNEWAVSTLRTISSFVPNTQNVFMAHHSSGVSPRQYVELDADYNVLRETDMPNAQTKLGMAYDRNAGVLWFVNDTTNELERILLDGTLDNAYALDAANTSPFSLAFNDITNELYVLEFTASGNEIYVYDTLGVLQASFSPPANTFSIDYDRNTDSIWVVTSSEDVYRISTTGTVLDTYLGVNAGANGLIYDDTLSQIHIIENSTNTVSIFNSSMVLQTTKTVTVDYSAYAYAPNIEFSSDNQIASAATTTTNDGGTGDRSLLNRGEAANITYYLFGARGQPWPFSFAQEVIADNGSSEDSQTESADVAGLVSTTYTTVSGDLATYDLIGSPKHIRVSSADGNDTINSDDGWNLSSKLLLGSAVGSNDGVMNTVSHSVKNRGETQSFSYYLSYARGTKYASKTGLNQEIYDGTTTTTVEDTQLNESTDSTGLVSDSYFISSGDLANYDTVGRPKDLECGDDVGNSADRAENTWFVSSKLLAGSAVGSNDGAMNSVTHSVKNRGEGQSFSYYLSYARGDAYVNKSSLNQYIYDGTTTTTLEDTQLSEATDANGLISSSYAIATNDLANFNTVGRPKDIVLDDGLGNSIDRMLDVWFVSSKLLIGSAAGSNDLVVVTNEEIYNRGESPQLDYFLSYARGDALASKNVNTQVHDDAVTSNSEDSQFVVTTAGGLVSYSYAISSGDKALADAIGSPKHVETNFDGNTTDDSLEEWTVSSLLTFADTWTGKNDADANTNGEPDGVDETDFFVGADVMYAKCRVLDVRGDPYDDAAVTISLLRNATLAQGPSTGAVSQTESGFLGWQDLFYQFDVKAPAGARSVRYLAELNGNSTGNVEKEINYAPSYTGNLEMSQTTNVDHTTGNVRIAIQPYILTTANIEQAISTVIPAATMDILPHVVLKKYEDAAPMTVTQARTQMNQTVALSDDDWDYTFTGLADGVYCAEISMTINGGQVTESVVFMVNVSVPHQHIAEFDWDLAIGDRS